MKIELREHAGCFGFELVPETMEDQALLARLAVNHTKVVRSVCVNAHADLAMTASVVLGKRRNAKSSLVPG